MLNLKKGLSCVECGESRYWVLDFHHKERSEKEDNLGTILFSKGKVAFQKELKKCIVLCSNCHRDLHHKERNSL